MSLAALSSCLWSLANSIFFDTCMRQGLERALANAKARGDEATEAKAKAEGSLATLQHSLNDAKARRAHMLTSGRTFPLPKLLRYSCLRHHVAQTPYLEVQDQASANRCPCAAHTESLSHIC